MKYFISGGAGFIGATLAHRLLERDKECFVKVYDNLSVGKLEFFDDLKDEQRNRLGVVVADIKDIETLNKEMFGFDTVYHFASNADISRAMSEPSVDFWEGTYLTQCILEAMRINNVAKIIYPSGSGVYGDWGYEVIHEDSSPMHPTSPYGASKLAGEALISAYCHMFDIKARIYRFANVIGRRQTHGIISDLIDKIKKDSKVLHVLGDGGQYKSYMHVDEVIDAIFITEGGEALYKYYNVSNETLLKVSEIVDIILEETALAGVRKTNTEVIYGNTRGGWKGDIPVVNLSANKLRNEGWRAKYSSAEAVRKIAKEILINGDTITVGGQTRYR